MSRVLVRARVSQDQAGGTSAEQQIEEIEKWAIKENHTIAGYAVDRNVSGSVDPFKTKDLGPWLTQPYSGEWDIIVAIDIKRLCRSAYWYIDIHRWSSENNKAIKLLHTPIDTSTEMGFAVSVLYASQAEQELNDIKRRNKQSADHLRKIGRWHGGRTPFGYASKQLPDKTHVLVPDPTESVVVEEIFRRVCDGESMQVIANDLNSRGVQTKEGTEWTYRKVRDIPLSRNYLGESTHEGQTVRDEAGMPVMRSDPIVSLETWKQANKVIDSRRIDARAPRKEGKTLLLRIAYCAECGGPLYERHAKPVSSDVKYRYWSCTGKRYATVEKCKTRSIPAPTLEGFVEEQFLRDVGDIERTTLEFVPGDDTADQLAAVEDSLKRLQVESDLGVFDGDTDAYAARLRPLVEQRNALRSQPNRPARWEARGMGETYGEAWERMDTAERRQLLIDAGVTVRARMVSRGVPDFSFHVELERIGGAVPGFDPDCKAAELMVVPELPDV